MKMTKCYKCECPVYAGVNFANGVIRPACETHVSIHRDNAKLNEEIKQIEWEVYKLLKESNDIAFKQLFIHWQVDELLKEAKMLHAKKR